MDTCTCVFLWTIIVIFMFVSSAFSGGQAHGRAWQVPTERMSKWVVECIFPAPPHWNNHYRRLVMEPYNQMGPLISQRSKGSERERTDLKTPHISEKNWTWTAGHWFQTGLFIPFHCVPCCSRLLGGSLIQLLLLFWSALQIPLWVTCNPAHAFLPDGCMSSHGRCSRLILFC